MKSNIQRMDQLVTQVANDICQNITLLTEDNFIQDVWHRKDFNDNPGGGGITRIIKYGNIIESGAVNTSAIYGKINPQFAKQLNGESDDVEAAGVSLIFHPRNPHVPSIHMNFRCIRQGDQVWFGGGADLTPFLPDEDMFRNFHKFWRDLVTPYSEELYQKMKKDCDKYFYLPHRGEMRGIGGIFYDYLPVAEENWVMVSELTHKFIHCYLPIIKANKDKEYTEEDRNFQWYRRGRYVEFNLLYDRGTIFGLKTNGRIESILASLPATLRYEYDYVPPKESVYAFMSEYYQPRDWSY